MAVSLRHVNYSLRPSIINAAKPAERPYVLTDGGGLYLEILPGGSKVWRYSYRLGGLRPKLTIRPYPQIGIAQARDQHEAMRAQVAQGIDPAAQRRAQAQETRQEAPRSVTFRDFSRVWVAETLGHLSERYRAQCIRFLDFYICPSIGDMRLDDVRPRDVLAILEMYKGTPTRADLAVAPGGGVAAWTVPW